MTATEGPFVSTNEGQSYWLRRNELQSNHLFSSFREMFDESCLFDCSIVCEGKVIQGHKFLLAAASQYFKSAFTSFENPCQNTAILIRDIPYCDLKIIIDFIYKGEVMIEEKQFPSLRRSVESLKVTCLIPQALNGHTPTTASQTPQSSANATNRQRPPLQQQPPPQQHQNSTNSNGAIINGAHPPGTYARSHLYPFTKSSQRPSTSSEPSKAPQSQSSYHPHEPFIQLRELLRNEAEKIEHNVPEADEESLQGDVDGEHDNVNGDNMSSEEFEIAVTPSAAICDERDDDDDDDQGLERDDGENDDVDEGHLSINDDINDDPTGDEVIDMSVNSLYSEQRNKNFTGKHSDEENDRKQVSPNSSNGNSSSDQFNVLHSLSLSAFSTTTARAIAASTTYAVASGLISNEIDDGSVNNGSNVGSAGASGSGNGIPNVMNGPKMGVGPSSMIDPIDRVSGQVFPLKRGRGRPPRHLKDAEEPPSASAVAAAAATIKALKTYKFQRQLLPSIAHDFGGTLTPSSQSGINRVNELLAGNVENGFDPLDISALKKRMKMSNPETFVMRGRRPRINGDPSDPNGKNGCPYCPQIYYSHQAMADHINNVHTGNAHKYICDVCGKEFSWKISLTKHWRNAHKTDDKNDMVDEKSLVLI